jgi:hypothetical protein
MKLGWIIAASLLVVVSTLLPLWAQDNPVAPVTDTDVVKPEVECTVVTPTPVSVSAPFYELLGPKIYAQGGLHIVKGKQRFFASEAEYNVNTEMGIARNVSFTTCDSVRPDYHITASSVTVFPDHRLNAKNVALYLGRTRVLVLPSMKFRIGGRSSTSAIFPRLGYDSRDGVTLAQSLRLTDTTHSRTTMSLRFTTKHSIEGELNSLYGAGGRLTSFPGRYLTYGSMRSRALDVPQAQTIACDPQLLRPTNAARLQPFGTFTLRQRTYDANNLGLVVFRQPEVGASYLGSQLSLTKRRLDPRIELYPQVVASWGRYKEIPGEPSYLSRSQIAMQASVNTVWLGPRTTIQPLGIATSATYSDGQFFRTWGFGLDVAHLASNGAYYSARYISRTSSGSTPFQFDNIDINQEVDLAVQTYIGKQVIGVAMNYNATSGSLFDWEVMYGRRSDCLGTYIRWDNRFQRFSFDVALINL